MNLEYSKSNGPHQQLSKLVGKWKGTAKTWFEPTHVADESSISGTMRLAMDGKYILHEYTGSFQGKPLQGLMIIGFDLMLNKYQTAWIDSFHTGTAIMFSESGRNEKNINVLGSYAYVTPETEQHWGWRTHIILHSDKQIEISAFNISPEGEEVKATEIIYERED